MSVFLCWPIQARGWKRLLEFFSLLKAADSGEHVGH